MPLTYSKPGQQSALKARNRVTAAILVLVVAALGYVLATGSQRLESPHTDNKGRSTYVGSAACGSCHATQVKAWQGSHHAHAMQPANSHSVLAPFAGERFTQYGVTTVFSQRNGHYMVRTDGPDGKLANFEVTHTLGITPLQQYLVPMSNGAVQVLGIAWDARPVAQGGQRWFHLQAGQHVRAGDSLHWTARQSTWNFMCAECHTTQFKKNFNAKTGQYASNWKEGDVGCEACHGPASMHLTWASGNASAKAEDTHKGWSLTFDERRGVSWRINAETGNAVRSGTGYIADTGIEMEMCARCHSHRSQISDDYIHGRPLLDTHVPSLLGTGLFWNDGQMKAEVFNFASFLQSRMAVKGVTCSDCHDPHTQQLRAPGNAVCLQCHAANKYDRPSHHFHKTGSTGASCTACHMPTTTYMTVDPRHDHSIRVPRPDLSQSTGSPNACTKCHKDNSDAWAADWAKRWYPGLGQRSNAWSQAMVASAKGDAGSWKLLLKLTSDRNQPAIVRASALGQMNQSFNESELTSVSALLTEADPLLRLAAVNALDSVQPDLRLRLLRPLLDDSVRGVRIAAARSLVTVQPDAWDAQSQTRQTEVLKEYIAVQQFNADRPESFNNLGMLYADKGDWSSAETALKRAIAMDPGWSMSSLNLADVYQKQGRENESQELIRNVLVHEPENAIAYHDLGLSKLRQHDINFAIGALKKAAVLDPGNVRYAYVYAVALEKNGQFLRAIQILRTALARFPDDTDLVSALTAFCKRHGVASCATGSVDRQ